MKKTDLLRQSRFPKSSEYDADWQTEGSFGGNSLWLAEWLCEELTLTPGMRVLDLGCGRAKSSIFLANEFGVQVWATDLWIDPQENEQRVRGFGLESKVTCHCAEADRLPFEFGFFDAILALDSMQYFGTGDLWLPYILQFLKPGGTLAFASAGVMSERSHPVPAHLKRFWDPSAWCLHTHDWWRNHWARTGLVDVEQTNIMPEGWKYWLAWAKACECSDWYVETLERDAGEYLGYIRAIARKSNDAANLTYDLKTGVPS